MGATLVDLRFIYGVSIDTIFYIQFAASFGYLTGALAGWLYKWINRQMALIGFVSVFAVTIVFVPYYHRFFIALVAILFNGIGSGAWDSASGFWMVEMWPVGNAVMLQLMQFMFGCGTVVAPLLVAPYVNGETTKVNNKTITVEDRIHALTMPFALTGVVQMIGEFPQFRSKLISPKCL